MGTYVQGKQDFGFNVILLKLLVALCSALTDLAYFQMGATLGGYVFIVNLVGAHSRILVQMG